MKVNELMIGDLAHIDGKIEKVRRNNIYGILCGDYDIKPIPLTAEILEKNGMKQGNGYWYLPNGSSPVEFSIDDDWEEGGNYFGICCGKPFPLNYVHELQHALRLCGLDERADNFQV